MGIGVWYWDWGYLHTCHWKEVEQGAKKDRAFRRRENLLHDILFKKLKGGGKGIERVALIGLISPFGGLEITSLLGLVSRRKALISALSRPCRLALTGELRDQVVGAVLEIFMYSTELRVVLGDICIVFNQRPS